MGDSMKVNFYVFIQVDKAEPWQIAEKILQIEGIETAHIVTGQYDIVAFALVKDLEELKYTVKKIQGLEGVQHTQTAVCIP